MATIEKIYILQFRNIENQYIKPNKDINLFIGDNAQGKTNLLEALYYLGHNRSFKTKNLKDIIPSNKQSVKIKAEIDGKKVELAKSKNKNTTTLEQQKISNNSKLTHLLPIQIISPDRGFVVGGTPKLKRSYVDWGVFHSQPPILQTYKSYNKTLKNLNTLFSSGECKQNEAWMYKLATFSVEISFARKHYVDKLNQKITKEFSSKLGGEEFFGQFFSFNYSPGWTKGVDELNKESVFSFLQKNINNFAKIKHLNYGPHKASLDFVFKEVFVTTFPDNLTFCFSIIFSAVIFC